MKWQSILPLVPLVLAAPGPPSHDWSLNTNETHERREPSSPNTVIIQMFEWDWDSVAAECENFIGPNGYGFVQGDYLSVCKCELKLTSIFSESAPRTYHWRSVVDGLSTCFLQSCFKTWRQNTVPEVCVSPLFSSH